MDLDQLVRVRRLFDRGPQGTHARWEVKQLVVIDVQQVCHFEGAGPRDRLAHVLDLPYALCLPFANGLLRLCERADAVPRRGALEVSGQCLAVLQPQEKVRHSEHLPVVAQPRDEGCRAFGHARHCKADLGQVFGFAIGWWWHAGHDEPRPLSVDPNASHSHLASCAMSRGSALSAAVATTKSPAKCLIYNTSK